ncbi:uncharacterized protein [Arachis hypogaea]|uniref:uncharacterized protein isoform X12 n=1 Tax=Arachis hypogaea TaxID=3818 RepID=UPI003B218223
MADGTLQSYRHHCAAPLSNDVVRSFETAHWTVLPFIRDSFCMIGYAIGATTSAFYGFNNDNVGCFPRKIFMHFN